MAFCSGCGTEAAPQARFCRTCGRPVPGAGGSAPAWVWPVIGVVAAAGIGVAIYLSQRKPKDDAKGLLMSKLESNERNAATSLKAVVTAEENLKGNDIDRNGIGDYWTADLSGLYWIVMTATEKPTACLSDLGMVYADLYTFFDAGGTFRGIDMDADGVPDTEYMLPAGMPRAPKAGYWYQALICDERGNAYAQDTDGTGNSHNYGQYGFCAIPAAYGETGRYCYIVNNIATVFRRDFGPGTIVASPGTQLATFDGKTPLNWPDASELGSKWEKVP